MKIFRCYLNPVADQWVDFPVQENANALLMWSTVMKEGVLADMHKAIPKASIHHVLLLDVETQGAHLTVFPGGKPN